MRHEANARRTRIIEYLTRNALHSFHRRPFVPTKSYDFPAVLLFDGRIPMLFRSPVELYHDSSIFDSTIGASVASMDLGISFFSSLTHHTPNDHRIYLLFHRVYISEAF